MVHGVDLYPDLVRPGCERDRRRGQADIAHVTGAGLARAAPVAVGSLHGDLQHVVHVQIERLILGLGSALHRKGQVDGQRTVQGLRGRPHLPSSGRAAAEVVVFEIEADVGGAGGPGAMGRRRRERPGRCGVSQWRAAAARPLRVGALSGCRGRLSGGYSWLRPRGRRVGEVSEPLPARLSRRRLHAQRMAEPEKNEKPDHDAHRGDGAKLSHAYNM